MFKSEVKSNFLATIFNGKEQLKYCQEKLLFSIHITLFPSDKITFLSKINLSFFNPSVNNHGSSGKSSNLIGLETITIIFNYILIKSWKGSMLMTISPLSRTEKNLCFFQMKKNFGQWFCKKALPNFIKDTLTLTKSIAKHYYNSWQVSLQFQYHLMKSEFKTFMNIYNSCQEKVTYIFWRGNKRVSCVKGMEAYNVLMY